MSAHDLDELWAAAVDEAAADDYVRRRFGVEPREDRSGLLLGEPPAILGQADEDDQFAAYMGRHFPNAGRD
jgi:hypothetical protein